MKLGGYNGQRLVHNRKLRNLLLGISSLVTSPPANQPASPSTSQPASPQANQPASPTASQLASSQADQQSVLPEATALKPWNHIAWNTILVDKNTRKTFKNDENWKHSLKSNAINKQPNQLNHFSHTINKYYISSNLRAVSSKTLEVYLVTTFLHLCPFSKTSFFIFTDSGLSLKLLN